LASEFHLDASSPAADQLLQETYQPNQDLIRLPETYDILNEQNTPLNLSSKELTTAITPEEFISAYKVVKQVTSSPPSGRHGGH
jgi:hypothetical protein